MWIWHKRVVEGSFAHVVEGTESIQGVARYYTCEDYTKL